MYRFPGNANQATMLQLSSDRADAQFSAQITNTQGQVIASLNSTSLQTVQLTVPASDTQYLVSVSGDKQEWVDSVKLALNPFDTSPVQHATSSQVTSPSNNNNTMTVAYTVASNVCELWVREGDSVYLYAQPIQSAQALLILPVNTRFKADARTPDGWYRLFTGEQTGWIHGDSVVLNGQCNTLPVDTMMQMSVSNPLDASAAPFDVDHHYFDINAQSGGVFTNAVSYPNGDGTDLIQAMLSGSEQARLIGLVMSCRGTGSASLRWGWVQNPTMGCGDTLSLSFDSQTRDTNLAVMLPAVNGQQYVDYQLMAMPIAPPDEEEQIMVLDRDRGGVIGQMVSYPAGDLSDKVTIYANNLTTQAPYNYRQMTVYMRCSGNATEYLRWGAQSANLRCGDSLPMAFSIETPIQSLTVTVQAFEGQSYIDYNLIALPSAPNDDESYWFGLDRDGGGVFNEVLSAPIGDTVDMIDLVMTNLTDSVPNQFREMTITLQCDGFGVEHIRWGLPENPSLGCGASVTTAFIHRVNQQKIEILSANPNAQTYVNYRVIVAPKAAEAILKNATG